MICNWSWTTLALNWFLTGSSFGDFFLTEHETMKKMLIYPQLNKYRVFSRPDIMRRWIFFPLKKVHSFLLNYFGIILLITSMTIMVLLAIWLLYISNTYLLFFPAKCVNSIVDRLWLQSNNLYFLFKIDLKTSPTSPPPLLMKPLKVSQLLFLVNYYTILYFVCKYI